MMMKIVYGDVDDDDDDVEDGDAQPMTNTMMMMVEVMTMMIMYRCSNPVYHHLHLYLSTVISIYLSIHQLQYNNKSEDTA